MTDPTWRLKVENDGEADMVDDLAMENAFVHFEDLGNAYMLIVENDDQHIHLTIPAHKKRKAWVFEQFNPKEDDQ